MAKPLNYPITRHVRLSEEQDAKLVRRAHELKTKPAALARAILDTVLDANQDFTKFKKAYKNVKTKS